MPPSGMTWATRIALQSIAGGRRALAAADAKAGRGDRHVGAQPVKPEPAREALGEVCSDVEQDRIIGRHEQEVGQIPALGREQRGVEGPGRQPADVVGHQPLEKAQPVAARDPQHRPVVRALAVHHPVLIRVNASDIRRNAGRKSPRGRRAGGGVAQASVNCSAQSRA